MSKCKHHLFTNLTTMLIQITNRNSIIISNIMILSNLHLVKTPNYILWKMKKMTIKVMSILIQDLRVEMIMNRTIGRTRQKVQRIWKIVKWSLEVIKITELTQMNRMRRLTIWICHTTTSKTKKV